MGTTVAYIAEFPGSASLAEQRACLDAEDHVLIGGRHSFNKLEDLLNEHCLSLAEGDRIKVFDLRGITLSTATLIRLITNMLRNGVTFEIVSAGIEIRPQAGDKLHALLEALDGHYRRVHGIKIHAVETASRGRRRLLEPEQLTDIRARLNRPGATATTVAHELGVGRSTLFNFLEKYDRERQAGRGKKLMKRSVEGDGDERHVAESEAGVSAGQKGVDPRQ